MCHAAVSFAKCARLRARAKSMESYSRKEKSYCEIKVSSVSLLFYLFSLLTKRKEEKKTNVVT